MVVVALLGDRGDVGPVKDGEGPRDDPSLDEVAPLTHKKIKISTLSSNRLFRVLGIPASYRPHQGRICVGALAHYGRINGFGACRRTTLSADCRKLTSPPFGKIVFIVGSYFRIPRRSGSTVPNDKFMDQSLVLFEMMMELGIGRGLFLKLTMQNPQ